MASQKRWVIINISLGFVAALLLLMLLGVELPSLGRAGYYLDDDEPVCIVEWQKELTLWDNLDACCLEARKQLGCWKEKFTLENTSLDRVCQTGGGEVLKYRLNDKAYNYCRRQVIW